MYCVKKNGSNGGGGDADLIKHCSEKSKFESMCCKRLVQVRVNLMHIYIYIIRIHLGFFKLA